MKFLLTLIALLPGFATAETIVFGGAPAAPAPVAVNPLPPSPTMTSLSQPALSVSAAAINNTGNHVSLPIVETPDTAAAVTTPDAPPPKAWVGKEGTTLKDSLKAWAASESPPWNVSWNAFRGDNEVNYTIGPTDIVCHGSIDVAARECVHLYDNSRIPLAIKVSLSQKLILVTVKN